MPLVPDLARAGAAPQPTEGQYVYILQSSPEPHVETFRTKGAAPTAPPVGLPDADDRKHMTGDDAIAWGSNLITSLFGSFTVEGDITDFTGDLLFGASQPGVEASAKQNLTSQITAGQEVFIDMRMTHVAGPGVNVSIWDGGDVQLFEAVVGSNVKSDDPLNVSEKHLGFVCPVTTSAAAIWIVDPTGKFEGIINTSVHVRDQSV